MGRCGYHHEGARQITVKVAKKRPREKPKGPSGIVLRPAFLKKFGIELSYVQYAFFRIDVLYKKKLGLTEARVLHDWLGRYIRFREDLDE